MKINYKEKIIQCFKNNFIKYNIKVNEVRKKMKEIFSIYTWIKSSMSRGPPPASTASADECPGVSPTFHIRPPGVPLAMQAATHHITLRRLEGPPGGASA